MNINEDRLRAGDNDHRAHERPAGAESPRELLAIHDPSKRSAGSGRQTTARGHGVTVQWLRPTELATRFAGQAAAGAVAAQVAAHRRVRDSLRVRLAGDESGRWGRLAPVSAFGRHTKGDQVGVERSVVGR
ncbi:MAG: hypothetical protein ACRDNS_30980 [Trebonia sp.]